MKLLNITFLLIMHTLTCLSMDNNHANNWTQSKYFNTHYLTRYEKVENDLIENEGFEYVIFPTIDKHNIHGVFYDPKKSSFSIIFCAGWLPGRKEGMLPFYAMLKKQNCSMLFFDARGHGNSDGGIVKSVPWYGQHEYKDVIAAIEFIYRRKNHPIYILGVCAGAFHTAHALIKLQEQNRLNKYNIKGFIFDSGWTSFMDVSYQIPREKIEEKTANILAKLCCCRKYDRTKNTWIKRAASSIATPLTLILHPIVVRIGFTACTQVTSCINKIKRTTSPQKTTDLYHAWKNNPLQIPVLFIHSYDDPTDIKKIKALAQYSNNATYWWIDKPSKHACHNLKHKEEYREHLLNFFKKHR